MKKSKTINSRLAFFMVLVMSVTVLIAGCEKKNVETSAQIKSQTAELKGQSSAVDKTQTAEDVKTVKDFNGDMVKITKNTGKIITVNSVATQIVLMLGGVNAAATSGNGLDYSADSIVGHMYPGVEKLTIWSRDTVNVESTMNMDADIILLDNKDTVANLRQSGIAAAYASVTSPETLMQYVRLVGDILGGDAVKKANKFCDYYQKNIDFVKQQTSQLQDSEKPVVFFARSTTATVGANTFPDFWISAAGGINAGSKLGVSGSQAKVTIEEVLNLNPDIIITEKPDVAQQFLTDKQYSGLNAVQHKKVYCAPVGMAVWSMGTAEEAVQILWAAQLLHTDLFKEVDVKAKTAEFYKEFSNYTVLENELTEILNPMSTLK